MATQAEMLRERLRNRKTENAERRLLRYPFILDDDLAARVQSLTMQYDSLTHLVESRREKLEEADEAGTRDVRASGHDASGLADALETAEKELARVRKDLDEAVETVNAGRFWMEFRPCSSAAYERVLSRFPGADDEGAAAKAAFLNALLAECFVRFEKDGETLDLGTWEEFVEEADMDFGELDPIRTAVFIACNRNPHTFLAG